MIRNTQEKGLINHFSWTLLLPEVVSDFLSVQEVLLGDLDVMGGELLWLVLADGDDRVAHL